MSKATDANYVLASAMRNCAFLEMAVYNYAKSAFSDETYEFLTKKRSFHDCLTTMIAIVREVDQIDDSDIVPLLKQAVGLQSDRNKIAHNPIITKLIIDMGPGENRAEHTMIDSRTSLPLKGEFSLENINELAVNANRLSGKISEARHTAAIKNPRLALSALSTARSGKAQPKS